MGDTDRAVIERVHTLLTEHLTLNHPQEPSPGLPSTVEVASIADAAAAVRESKAGTIVRLRPGDYTTGLVLERDGGSGPRVTLDLTNCALTVPSGPALRTARGGSFGCSQISVLGGAYASKSSASTLVEFGRGDESSVELFPVSVSLEHAIIAGDRLNGQKRGIAMCGLDLALLSSEVTECKRDGQDAQAVWINGPGPVTIRDSYLEGSGENIMAGGADPLIHGLVPSDILIDHCTLAKPFAWMEELWDVKNLLELKNARRVTMRGCTLRGNWQRNQVGYAVLLTPKNQSGRAPWTCVEDVLIEHNAILDTASVFNVASTGSEYPIAGMKNIILRENHCVTNRARFGGDGRFLLIQHRPTDPTQTIHGLVVTHNVAVVDGPAPIYLAGGPLPSDAVIDGNVYPRNKYGWKVQGWTDALGQYHGGGEGPLHARSDGTRIAGNVVGGASPSLYPEDRCLTMEAWQALFTDFAAGKYQLKAPV
jgi:hypothetical protein